MSKIQVNVEDLKNFADIIGDIENQCGDALRHLNWDFSSFLTDLPGVSPKRVKEVEEIYRNVIKKYQAKLDHAQQLVKHTEAAMRQAEKNIGDKAGEFGLEMLGYYDVQRVFGEYDPITGEKVSGADRLLATGMLALSLYPPGKAVGVTGKAAIKGANAGTKTGTKFGLSSFAKSPIVFQSLKNVVSTGKVLEVFKGVYKQVVEAPLAATKLWLDRTVRQIADFRMSVFGTQLATPMGAVPLETVGEAKDAFVKMVKGEGDNLNSGSKGKVKISTEDFDKAVDKAMEEAVTKQPPYNRKPIEPRKYKEKEYNDDGSVTYLIEKNGTEYKVTYDKDGHPVFDPKHEAFLPKSKYLAGDKEQFSHLSKELYEKAMKNQELKKKFTDEELEIFELGEIPFSSTWHHHHEPGKVQLVDSEIHDAAKHTGGRAYWGGGSDGRKGRLKSEIRKLIKEKFSWEE